MNMRSYLARKLVYLVITLWATITFNFFLFRIMPGDPVRIFVQRGMTPELRDMIMKEFYLDKSLPEQYLFYLRDLFSLDFGISAGVWKMQPIADYIMEPLFNTVLLVGIGTILAVYFGVALGRAAAWRRGKAADTVGMAFALVFYSMPTFLFALIILMLFADTIPWFPISGPYGSLPFVDRPPRYEDMALWQKVVSRGYHLILPVFAFTIEMMAEYALIMRNSLTDVLTEDYIVTARAKGLSNMDVLRKHAMRNALLPVVTVAAISIGWMLGGDIMVEIVFGYDGIGMLTWEAVNQRDFPVLQILFLIMAIVVLIANLFADILYMYLDPRVTV